MWDERQTTVHYKTSRECVMIKSYCRVPTPGCQQVLRGSTACDGYSFFSPTGNAGERLERYLTRPPAIVILLITVAGDIPGHASKIWEFAESRATNLYIASVVSRISNDLKIETKFPASMARAVQSA